MHIPAPDPALKRLEILVGKWELRGRTLAAKEDNITGWTTFAWMLGGFFLEARGEINFKGDVIQSLEIISYNPVSKTFPSYVFSNLSGSVLPYFWDVQGNTVTHWMESSRYTGTLSADGNTLSGGWRPLAGTKASDESTYDAVMTRVK